MREKRTIWYYAALLLASVLFIVVGNRISSQGARMFLGQTGAATERLVVRVERILDTQETRLEYGGQAMTQTETRYTASVLAGARKGEQIEAVQVQDTMSGRRLTPVAPGDWVFVYLTPGTDATYYTGEFVRLRILLPVAVVFVLLLVVFARAKGLASVLALGLSVLAIFLVFIPAILSGRNVYFWAILICLYSIGITPFFIGGFNKKSAASALGCVGGVAVAGALTALLNGWMKITGAVDEDAMMVSFILEEPIDLRAITFAAILIGALGATIDVSMSIASAMYEMTELTPGVGMRRLTAYGMSVGRDIIGAQISTLVLAYIGGSLSVVLLLVAYQGSVFELLNLESVIIELLQALIGSFTILFTIPATAAVCGAMFGAKAAAGQSRRRYSAKQAEQPFRIGHPAGEPAARRPGKRRRR